MSYSDEFLEALGHWQNGWGEDQGKRARLAESLKAVYENIPAKVRTPPEKCFRKRFLHYGDYVDVFLNDHKDEGVTSWTTDKAWAERFKDLTKEGAIAAAIFRHSPVVQEVLVNIPALWKDEEFVQAASKFKEVESVAATALWHFRDTQSEVIIDTPLKGSEIVAMVAKSSHFDDICDYYEVPEPKRDDLFRELIESGDKIAQPRWVEEEGVSRAASRAIYKVKAKVDEAIRREG